MQGSKARRSALILCGGASRFGSGDGYALGNKAGLDIAPERDGELAAKAISMMRRIRLDWPAVLWMYQCESGLAG